MSKQVRSLWVLAMVAVVAAGLAGCARPLKEQVLGKWRHSTGLELNFLKDGSFTAAQGPLQATGKYATPDEKHLKLEISGLLGAIIGSNVYEAGVKDTRLTLVLGTKPQEFTRAQ